MNGKEAIKELQRVYDSVLLGDLNVQTREDIYSRLNAVIDWLELEQI